MVYINTKAVHVNRCNAYLFNIYFAVLEILCKISNTEKPCTYVVLRRKLLLLVNYFQLLRNKIQNPVTLSRIGILVPRQCKDIGDGPVAPRRRPRLFYEPRTRTRHAQNSPTQRALALINVFLSERPHIDLFHCSLSKLSTEAELFLTFTNNRVCGLGSKWY